MNRGLLDPTRRYASTALVAEALGVSVTTVKRWVDDGILPAQRTPGGHRKLLCSDVIRLARDGRLPHADLSKLDGGVVDAKNSTQEAMDRLVDALLTGNAESAREIIHGAYHRGFSIEWLADEVIAPAMAAIGHRWEAGQIDVLHEHRGTQLVAGTIFELKAVLDRHAEQTRPVALGGAIERDHYLLPTLLAQTVLLDMGWQATNLGPNTPLTSFRRAMVELKPRLIWLSASHLEDVERFNAEYRSLYRHAMEAKIAVVVGGQAFSNVTDTRPPCTIFGENLTDLASFAATLSPRRTPPKRGRPLKT